MANASSSTGNSTTSRNSDDETKELIESMEEKQEEVKQNIDEIKIVIKSLEEKLEGVSSSRACYNIYRVPRQIYKQKPDAYTPQSVSIGPLHHNDQHLQFMETHKLHYLHRLLKRYRQTLDFCVQVVSALEEDARKYYSDTMSLGKDKFVEMMVIDGCFILEFLAVNESNENDHFSSNSSWFLEISSDLIKLENQLPLFVLERLDAQLRRSPRNFSFSWYVYDNIIKWHAGMLNGPTFSTNEEFERLLQANGGAKHFLDLLRCILIPSSSEERPSNKDCLQLTYNASELRSSGVEFKKKEAASLLEIDFDMKKGVLAIPTIKIFDETDIILRNLIAFEQDKASRSRYFTTYAVFMDCLVDTTKDLTLLTHKGIIENHLGNREDVVTLFNNITMHVCIRNPYLSSVIKDLDEYYNKSWNKRMANLRQNYFHTPWSVISIVAAAFLIFLTVIQTVCSVMQLI